MLVEDWITEERAAARTWHRRFIPHFIRHPLARTKAACQRVKWRMQRAMRGYSDVDVWNPGSAIAQHALPILRAYRVSGFHGLPWGLLPDIADYPYDGYGDRWPEAEAAWADIVDRSIRALEVVADERELGPEETSEQHDADLRLFGEWLPAMWD